MRRSTPKRIAGVVMVLCGLLASQLGAQEPKIDAYPWMDIYGATGKPIGTIRILQKVLHGVKDHSLVGEFVPDKDGFLDDLAVTLWPGADKKDLHFNWIQVITNSGNPPTPVDAASQPLFAPFVDPPAGGYFNDPKPADDLPWFLDETPYVARQSAAMNIHNTAIVRYDNHQHPYVLTWYMKPYSAATPDKMYFDTVLVLIDDKLGQYQPLGGFHWGAFFPSTGEPYFKLDPFHADEVFPYAQAVADFNKSRRGKNARVWKLKPLDKSVKQGTGAQTPGASSALPTPKTIPNKP